MGEGQSRARRRPLSDLPGIKNCTRAILSVSEGRSRSQPYSVCISKAKVSSVDVCASYAYYLAKIVTHG